MLELLKNKSLFVLPEEKRGNDACYILSAGDRVLVLLVQVGT
jgi:hypothetical protein